MKAFNCMGGINKLANFSGIFVTAHVPYMATSAGGPAPEK